ncbi:bilirubin oxidase precursor [Leptodontidium sp. 2 PMI_412]|nr:bilirubin oxidase precursor [Leptodontidium sp. 2 PMI_412]
MLTQRAFLSSFATSLLLGLTSAAGNGPSPAYKHFYEFPLPVPPIATPLATYTKSDGSNIDYYEIHIKGFTQQVYPELPPTRLVGYNGISPGPTFHMTFGTEAVVRFINEGNDKPTVTHLHGSITHPPWDGWAEDTIPVGFYKDYYYPNAQRARTLWYHDHAIDHTAENAYFGQAGFYILSDNDEKNSGLPQGKYDIPMALSSKQYETDGQLVSPATQPGVSLFGDIIHVNGQPWPFLNVEPRKYRFRLLDVSVSRAFRLYFVTDLGILEDDTSHHIPFYVVGSDSGRTSKPVQTPDLWISMAERWEIVVDFAPYAGKPIYLKNFYNVQADTPYNNTNQVMKFNVGTTVSDTSNNGPVPAAFAPLPLPPSKDLSKPDHVFNFESKNGAWKINGVTFDDINNRVIARPPRGAVELWKLVNNGGGWSHPIHVHLVDFQVVSRQKGSRGVQTYEAAALQDVVLLGQNEEVYVLARYTPWEGLYMFHCHNLVHEDHAMMAAFNVTSLPNFNYPPNTARFIDPLDPRFISKKYDASVQTLDNAVNVVLPAFANLKAYDNHEGVEDALVTYYQTATSTISDTAPTQSEFNGKGKREAFPTGIPFKA